VNKSSFSSRTECTRCYKQKSLPSVAGQNVHGATKKKHNAGNNVVRNDTVINESHWNCYEIKYLVQAVARPMTSLRLTSRLDTHLVYAPEAHSQSLPKLLHKLKPKSDFQKIQIAFASAMTSLYRSKRHSAEFPIKAQ